MPRGTFQHGSIPVPKNSKETTLGKTGYDSFGGTLVSTVHEGMDSFALSYVPELYELGEQTGQTRWIERESFSHQIG